MKKIYIVGLLSFGLITSCSQVKKLQEITIKNNLDFERTSEVVTLTKELLEVNSLENLGVQDLNEKIPEITQLVDVDGDGIADQLLFQPKVKANSEKKYQLVLIERSVLQKLTGYKDYCYSRFVPERTDDYTWENDKVAFRVFGPVAQKMIEDGSPGGTLSSGVDAWLKRVEYPIIDKWYKKNAEGGSYHEDTGEGMDNFHVGKSRGVGGIAVRTNDTLYYSKNFTKWRTITSGPLRTSFYLEYASWDAGGKQIKEGKVITLDKGNNLSKFETFIHGTDAILAGLTLHEKDGVVTSENGWVSYWQPHADSELGTAILADIATFENFEKYDVEDKDLSNAFAHLKVQDSKVIYYSGFAWKESLQYPTKESWEAYLNAFAKQVNSPLEVTLK